MCICDFIRSFFVFFFELIKAVASVYFSLPLFSQIVLVFVILAIAFAMYIYDMKHEDK